MSRSKRKTPKCGNAGCRSEKQDKRICNRMFRRKARQVDDPDAKPVYAEEIMDRWAMGKDGKHRFDPHNWPQGMRK